LNICPLDSALFSRVKPRAALNPDKKDMSRRCRDVERDMAGTGGKGFTVVQLMLAFKAAALPQAIASAQQVQV
jgi:hypothetical protein